MYLKWVKIRGDEVKIKVKTNSLIWIQSESGEDGKNEVKTVVESTEKISSQTWDENEVKNWLKQFFQNCPCEAKRNFPEAARDFVKCRF